MEINARNMKELARENGKAEIEKKIYSNFDEKIEQAAKQGKTRIFFDCGGYEDPSTGYWVTASNSAIPREEMKEHYSKLGFVFRHVGMVGGVMQAPSEEDICW